MGKAQKERAGRKRLRTAYEKLKNESSDHAQASIPVSSLVDERIRHETAGAIPDEGDEPSKPSKFEKRLKKKSRWMERLEKGGLGVKKVSTKKENRTTRKRAMFSFESLMKELGDVDVAVQDKQAKRDKRQQDFSRHRNRCRMMAKFSKRISEVRNDPAYASDPFGAAMSFLESTLPAARTREEVDEQWRKEQRKLMKGRGRKRLGWHDK